MLYFDYRKVYIFNINLGDIHLSKLINEHFTNSFFLTKAPIILNEF